MQVEEEFGEKHERKTGEFRCSTTISNAPINAKPAVGGGGRRGIGRDFDRSLWPGGRAFELSCYPGGRDI